MESIAHLNIGGLKRNLRTIESYMLANSISWCFLSETWLSPAEESPSPNLAINIPFMSRQLETGHYPYGIGVLINPTICSANEFKILKSDYRLQYLLFEYRGISFACAYVQPNCPAQAIQERLSFLFSRLDDSPLFLVGDFNGRLREFGDHSANAQGTSLLNFVDIACLTRIPSLRGLWTFRRGDQRSIPDHTFANDLALSFEPVLVIDEEASFTDHRPSILSFVPISQARPYSVSKARTGHWNRWKLNDQNYVRPLLADISFSFTDCINAVTVFLNDISLDYQARIDLAMQTVVSWCNRLLGSNIGRVGPSSYNVRTLGSPDEMFTRMWISSLQSRISRSSEPTRSVLINTLELAESQLRVQCQLPKADYVDKLWNGLDNNSQQKLFKSLLQKKNSHAMAALSNDAESLDSYRSYYSSRYSGSCPLQYNDAWYSDFASDFDDSIYLDMESIGAVLQSLPKGKAPGRNGIPSELLRIGHRYFAGILERIFNFCLRYGVVPSEWRTAVISPIPKKTAVKSIEDTRPISLTDVFRKVFEKALLPLITSFVEPLHISQGGFRDRRGCIDQVAYLQEFVAQSDADNLDMFITFLDIKAAYDTVHRPLLWHKCRQKGLPEYLIQILKALFDDTSACIGIRGANSASFPLASGLLQGSILSPLLYALFINDLAEALQDTMPEANFCGLRLFCLFYADDIVIFSNEADHHRQLLQICHDHSRLNGYSFNIGKCCSISTTGEVFSLNYETIPISKSYNYLGFIFNINGIDWPAHFNRLAAKAENTVSQFKSLGLCSPALSPSTLTTVFKTFIRPVFEYGLAISPPRSEWLIQPGVNSSLRALFGLPSRSCLQALCAYMGIEPVGYRLHRLGARWASQTADKSDLFAICEAKELAIDTLHPISVFSNLLSNPLMQADDLSTSTYRSHLNLCWSKIIDRRKAFGLLRAFGILRRSELTRLLRRMRRSTQHALVRWAIGSDYGPWRACPNCDGPSSDRPHLEACVLGLDGWYDEQFDSCLFTFLNRRRTLVTLELIGKAIELIRSI